ncbi:MAG: alpha-amylase family glycosyl hydrolase, partial [Candidatus Hodarchaeales archaeon]
LSALDLFAEEEKMRGLGAGEAVVYTYEGLEENYTPDADWMPNVVMIAKNTYVWLDQLSKKYKKEINRLDQIPDEELEQLARWGFNALWLIGLWERSPASKTLKRWCGNPEAEASAYSLFDYVIANDIGGESAYQNLKSRAWRYGIRLASDMVPNHTGIDSKWTREHPEWYISLPYPPFPSYSYSGANLCDDPSISIYLEDHYFDRSDAAVTFKHVDRSGQVRYIYHGNDGTSFPWNDTAQLNYLIPEVREAVIQMILHVARKFPIIRFDAAMTLTRKHYQRLWFPPPGSGGDIPSRAGHGLTNEEFYKAMPKEFWREVVERINEEMPDTLLLAEAFWLLEGFFVRTLGMHRVYNSAFMNMLRDEDNAKYRTVIKNTLEFDPEILKRFVNFMNNPDEETAVKQFGKGEKYFGICLLLATLPGLPMFGHGQVEGYSEKYGMEYRKAYWDEQPDWGLVQHHERVIFPLMKKRYLFSEVNNFLLYDFFTSQGYVDENVFCHSNGVGQERALIVYNNSYSGTSGWIKTSAACLDKATGKLFQKTLAEGLLLSNDDNKYWLFRDQFTGLEYIRKSSDIYNKGLHVILGPYQAMALVESREIDDNEMNHYSILNNYLNGRGVPSIEDSRQKLIYGELHQPIQKLLDKEYLERLVILENKDQIETLVKEIRPLIEEFYTQVLRYSKIETDPTGLTNEVERTLQGYLNLKISDKDILKINQVDDFVLLTWVLLRGIGKVKEESERFTLASRSMIEEWLLDKIIEEIYRASRVSKDTIEISPLVKVLIKQQLWVNRQEKEPIVTLRNILKDSEVQAYIKVNRHSGILWFNKEFFESLIKYLCLIAMVQIYSKDMDTQEQLNEISTIRQTYEVWRESSEKSGYQLERLLSIGEES